MKILVVDDHQLIREGLAPVMRQLAPLPAEVAVLEAATYQAALAQARAHPDLDLVLLDLHLPDVAGFAALDGLQAGFPAIPVIVVSGADDPDLVKQALAHGALGFIPKSSSSAVILSAIRLVLSGGTYIPPVVMVAASPLPAAAHIDAAATERLGITPRQADVLALLLAGKSNKLISRELNLAEGTVKNHVAAVLKALGVETRVQAVIAATRLGLK